MPNFPFALAAGKKLQKDIQVLIAAAGFAIRPILREDEARNFGFSLTNVPLGRLETELSVERPDVLLIDSINEEDREALLGLLRRIRRNYPALKCVLLAEESAREFLVMAFQSGIRGFVPAAESTSEILGRCIACVHDGQIWIPNETLVDVLDAFSKAVLPSNSAGRGALSPREQQVMDLVIQGLSNRDIADALQVTESTVKKYVYEVFNKTGASSRVELVLRALQPRLAA